MVPYPSNGIRQAAPEELQVLIVILAFNKAEQLLTVVRQALAVHRNVLVVDDGSTADGVGMDIFAELGVEVVRNEQNRGRGAAVLTACRNARRMRVTHIITVDAGGLYDPHDFQVLYEAICRDVDALIVGRRNRQKTARSRMASFWLRLQTGVNLIDPRCGFRAYPLAVLENLTLWSRGYSFDMEVLVRAAWAGVAIKEVSISAQLPERSVNSSFYRAFINRVGHILLNIHLTMRSITPLPHRKIVLDKDRPGEKISVLHPMRSIRALLTENISPGQLALASALGVFLGTLPLIFLHNVTILFAAGYFRLNKVAALVASTICMPPIVPALCIEAGYFMRRGKFLTEISIETIGYQAHQRLFEWLLGSLLLAPVLAALVGGIIFLLAYYIQKGILQRE